MSLAHRRHADVLALVAPLILAPAVGEFIRKRSHRRHAAALDSAFTDLAGGASLRGAAIVGLIVVALAALFVQQPLVRKPDPYTPAAALKFAGAHDLIGPVFNEYGFGGYLTFNGIKPFIDGRAEMYGDDFVKRYVEATRGVTDELPAMLDQYHVTWTLFAVKSPAATLMDHLAGWKRVYADNTAIIHVRTDSGR